eukprot:TRINITY_DN241_c0_g1_i1.p1 TRINITY_DN241_c0_g1~~TRINITY_DN241_c0_g1_i1.p1  ORF type:complete len:496 (-),score=97.99 TRINITY_DN241_c0_g1_i1:131-1588(-)
MPKNPKQKLDYDLLNPTTQGYLEADEGEKTYRISQSNIRKHVDKRTQKKLFRYNLSFGPYHLDFSLNGQQMLLSGEKGHVSLYNWHKNEKLCEFQTKKTISKCKILGDTDLFGLCLPNDEVRIYDGVGREIHRLSHHKNPIDINYLPYHYLLNTISLSGHILWQDISTGEIAASYPCASRVNRSSLRCLANSPKTAVSYVGHSNGTVSLWSPRIGNPEIQLKAHNGPISNIAVSNNGFNFITVAVDGRISLWDERNFKSISSWNLKVPPSSIDLSQKNCLAVASGSKVSIYNNIFSSEVYKKQGAGVYMTERFSGDSIMDVRFCPYEDFLGLGMRKGVCSMIVPGSAESNYDTFEHNLYESKRQKREGRVKRILDKIPADMIGVNLKLGNIRQNENERVQKLQMMEDLHQNIDSTEVKKQLAEKREKRRMRGKSKSMKRYLRKQTFVNSWKKVHIEEKLAKEDRLKELETNPKEKTKDAIFGRFK